MSDQRPSIGCFMRDVDVQRLVLEVAHAAGDKGIDAEEIIKAHSVVEDMFLDHSLIENWKNNEIRFGWDVEEQDLVMFAREEREVQ